jgi:prepilin-type N-terminal cleavage/methylation domain-containing protein
VEGGIKLKKAFTLIELLIVVAIIAILAAIAVPNFLEAQTRAKVSRVLSDQRTYATALETYMIDNSAYPAYYPVAAFAGTLANITDNYNSAALQAAGDGTAAGQYKKLPSFAFKNAVAGNPAQPPISLTTPVSYLSTYVPDTFASNKTVTFGYVNGPAGFLLWSPGPDGLDHLNSDGTSDQASVHNQAERIMHGGQSLPSPYLLAGPTGTMPKPAGAAGTKAFTYDATNGTASDGDVYRTK